MSIIHDFKAIRDACDQMSADMFGDRHTRVKVQCPKCNGYSVGNDPDNDEENCDLCRCTGMVLEANAQAWEAAQRQEEVDLLKELDDDDDPPVKKKMPKSMNGGGGCVTRSIPPPPGLRPICHVCNGMGYIQNGMKSRPCNPCSGTGLA